MSKVKVVTPSGKGGRDVELPAEFFGVKVNIPLMHQVVVAQEAAARQGTHATKTRGAVPGPKGGLVLVRSAAKPLTAGGAK